MKIKKEIKDLINDRIRFFIIVLYVIIFIALLINI
jgi:hypothetical protein